MTGAAGDQAAAPEEREERLLSPEFQARLAALEFTLRKALPSNLRGDRRSPHKKGISLEFADFRNYVPGDDVRHLDWSAWARLDQLIVKLYHDEEDLQLHLLVDDSRSMRFGSPTKARFARQVAAALAWIGLRHSQRVSLTLLGDAPDGLPLRRGGAALPALLERLQEPPGSGATPLVEGLQAFMAAARPRGAVVLISDLLDRAGPSAILSALQRPITEVTVIQVLAKAEVDPDLEGDLRLIDVETGLKVELNLSPAILDAYRARVRSFIALFAETARRRDAAFLQTTSDVRVEDFLLRSLVQEHVLR